MALWHGAERAMTLGAVVTLLLGCGEAATTSDGSTGTPSGGSGGSGGMVATGGMTGATGGATGGTSSTTTLVSSSSTGNPPFVLDVHTALAPGGGLELTTNLPAHQEGCLAVPFEGVPCGDLDQDGLTDAWEDVVIDRLRPLLRLDEEESLVNDPAFVIANVARVAPDPVDVTAVRALMMIGYSKDFGSCGFTAHNGDSERVALNLKLVGVEGNVTVLAAYTAAHEGTPSDHGKMVEGSDLAGLVYENDAATGEPRWVVFPSQDKHGTYATVEICENISFVPCFDEDCGPDNVADPKAFDRLPPYVNAGEESHPLVTDLTSIGFAGDDAWANQDFCGGLGGSGCSAPVRDKLLNDPFGP
ncbi:MAG: hypothetical protein IPK82_32675 [Polyangiaceae bacterium]|nr:hypothetical protein [Polyangiaceae bacterium]